MILPSALNGLTFLAYFLLTVIMLRFISSRLLMRNTDSGLGKALGSLT